jgi:hypothetical protein
LGCIYSHWRGAVSNSKFKIQNYTTQKSFGITPKIDPVAFRLTIDGEVNNPVSLSMEQIQQIPLTSMTIRHVCVEGWAAIVQWDGVGKRGQEGGDGLLTTSEILDLKLLPSRQNNIYTVLETKCDFLPSV